MTPARTFRTCDIDSAVEFTAPVHRDDRGQFTNVFRGSDFRSAVDRPLFAVRDVSFNVSGRGVLRGIHYTAGPPGRAKYVYCPHGRVRDYLVDLRVGSPTYGRSVCTELSGDNGRALYIPIGVGHAFLALEDRSTVVYLMSEEYDPLRELAVSALDPDLGLSVPPGLAIARSERDTAAPTLAEARAGGLLPEYRSCLEAEAALWQ
ncbi:dTDP-4-dehydrorhamnose 3,5-epimerase [Micromonospora andamanensis]|uniref:dTDP-4-dehydrorhamnose 3,5-epimerase family protein n=1 Tax=Micromonospora andamanensis TaxID=1287068 RepID=UPI00194FF7E6|nr:dTDP-4-dehydrorhamnose 3,5-epimerase [Micromonospora andamanensis]GIJ42508.1 dTDP-4-dehydrorhamnose 3,5-epimerase [Micromonospora andamanensis]